MDVFCMATDSSGAAGKRQRLTDSSCANRNPELGLIRGRVHMATNMYIKFEDPAIEGAATAAGHEKEMEILSWNHGFSQPASPTRSTAGRGTVEQATHQNLSF